MRKILVFCKDELIFGGHIMSLGAAAMVYVFAAIGNYPIVRPLLIATYLSVHSIYLFDRYRDLESDILTNPERVEYLSRHKRIIASMIVIFLLTAFGLILISGGVKTLLYSLTLFLFGFTYSFGLKDLTRTIVGFKSFFVPLPYVVLVYIYTIYQSQQALGLGGVILLSFIFIRLFVATAFYDLKDVNDDKKQGLKTFAAILSPEKFYSFLMLLNYLSIIPLLVGVMINILPNYSLVLLLVVPYFSYYLNKSRQSNNLTLLSYIYCDGEYLLWLSLVLSTKLLLKWH